jgi:hypothetical protein
MTSSGNTNQCTAVGVESLQTNGSSLILTQLNTAIGYRSLYNNIAGSYNTSLGYNSGLNLTTNESDNIMIGDYGTIGDNNTIRIGINDGSARAHTRNFQAGIAGVTVANSNTVVINTVTGQLGTVPNPTIARAHLYTTPATATAAVATVPITLNAFDIVATTTNFNNTTPNQLQYTGSTTQSIYITINISVALTAINNNIVYSIYKNGAPLTGTDITTAESNVTNTYFNYTLSTIDTALTNDYYELWATSVGNETITLQNAIIIAYIV